MEEITSLARNVPLAFAALLPVVNPLGTAIILLGLTEDADPESRARIAMRVAINTALLLGVVLVAGRPILGFFGISVPIVQLAGGLVLAAMGWKLLFSPDGPPTDSQQAPDGSSSRGDYDNRIFYPFTFPLTVGPGGVAVAITLSAHTSREHFVATVAAQLASFAGIVAVAAVTYFCLANAGRIAARLGPSGMSALVRLSAFIVVCLGAEIAWNGARVLLRLPAVSG
jgi:multiple antibiotic resistance protein